MSDPEAGDIMFFINEQDNTTNLTKHANQKTNEHILKIHNHMLPNLLENVVVPFL